MRSSHAVIGVFLAALSAAPDALAQPASDDARAKARSIGEEGLSFFDQGMYIDALERFERADAITNAPTLGLMAARSLEKLKRFVEASERYLLVTRMEIDPKSADVWKQAIISAIKEREALMPRIPSIEIVLEGPGASGASVKLDGQPVPKAVIGVRTPIDPGIHRIEATGSGGTYAFDRVTVSEKQASRLVLTLKASARDARPDTRDTRPDASVLVSAGTGAAASAGTGPAATSSAPAPESNAMSLGVSAGSEKRAGLDQTRAAARMIGEEGLSFYDQGRYIDALDRFDRADNLIRAPTIGLMAARSLERLGRLVEASLRYEDVTQRKVDTASPESFKQAQVTALKERDALMPRIPSIDVSVQGPGAGEVSTVLMDGKSVPPSLVGAVRPIATKIPADPGDHRLEVKASTGEAFERVTLGEGATARVVLTLSASSKRAAKSVDPLGEKASSEPPPQRGKMQRTVGWVSLGIGAAGIATGAIVGGIAANKRGDFSGQCDETTRTCPTSVADDVNTYNALRPVSTVGFVLGAIGGVTGVVLLVTLPRGGARYSNGSVEITPWLGAGSVGINGAF